MHLALLQWLHGCDHQMLPKVASYCQTMFVSITNGGEDGAMALQLLSFTVSNPT